MKRVFVPLLISSVAFAHPLLNVNTEERIIYENFEASKYSSRTSVSLRPYSLFKVFRYTESGDRVKLYLNALSEPGFFIKPINSVTLTFFYTSEDRFVLENSSGTELKKGVNYYTFLDGYLSLGRRFVAYYQFRYIKSEVESRADVYRAYGKLKLWKLSLELGKDSVHLGPGEFSLLLSSNAEPFPMIKLQTERSLNLLGKWDFLFVRGWLREDRRDRNDPSILALRIAWKPWDFIEIGGTRTAMYGGEGRPGYKLTEYPKLILGSEENIPYGKYDSDGYGAYDITLYLPVYRWLRQIKVFKLYYQEAGTDILAWWQKEDRGKFRPPFGFSFLDRGYIGGVFVSTHKDIFRLELNKVSDRWYLHHLYNVDGYTYKGLSLGHPYGSNMLHIYFKHRHYFSDKLSLMYRIGYWEQPREKYNRKMNRYYILTSAEKRFRSFILSGFLRIDHTKNYDRDPSPTRFDMSSEGKNFITVGASLSWRL